MIWGCLLKSTLFFDPVILIPTVYLMGIGYTCRCAKIYVSLSLIIATIIGWNPVGCFNSLWRFKHTSDICIYIHLFILSIILSSLSLFLNQFYYVLVSGYFKVLHEKRNQPRLLIVINRGLPTKFDQKRHVLRKNMNNTVSRPVEN